MPNLYNSENFTRIMKRRVTFNLDAALVEKLEASVDGKQLRNLSHAAEFYLSHALELKSVRHGVILAGGKGTRLAPLTNEIPKPLVPIHDKPIMEHVIELYRMNGIEDIIVIVAYKAEKIIKHFGDGAKYGVRLSYAVEEERGGTAGALRAAKHMINGTFVMSNCDELKDVPIRSMISFHRKHAAKGTIALTSVDDPSAYGVARMDGERIIEFVEKPSREDAPTNLINAGLYILDRTILDYVPDQGFSQIETDVFPKLAAEGVLYGYHFPGQWFDTGTFERYEEALTQWRGFRIANGE